MNLWLISNKNIMEVGNITKAATFKTFLHLSYKNKQIFLVTVFLITSSTPSRYCAKFWRWCHHYDADVIIVRPWKNMKNFKYCAISLNMVHAGGLCGVLGFTAPLILIAKKFRGKYIYTLNSALCVPIAQAAIKQLLFGA